MDRLFESFLTHRRVIGYLGLMLPILTLLIGGVQSSVSASYYTPARDIFVAGLASIGLFLLCYRGYDSTDAKICVAAGLSALIVALVPVEPDLLATDRQLVAGYVHKVFAVLFFMLLAHMCLAQFTKSQGPYTRQKQKRNRVYVTCGALIHASVALAIFGVLSGLPTVWIAEFVASLAFGSAWLVKGELILADN